jgi:hypothetical protein
MLCPAGEIALYVATQMAFTGYSVATYLHFHLFLASLLDILTLDDKTIFCLKTERADYPLTQQHIPEEENLHKQFK